MSNVCYSPLRRLVDWSIQHRSRWTRPLVSKTACNHTHTWWHVMEPLTVGIIRLMSSSLVHYRQLPVGPDQGLTVLSEASFRIREKQTTGHCWRGKRAAGLGCWRWIVRVNFSGPIKSAHARQDGQHRKGKAADKWLVRKDAGQQQTKDYEKEIELVGKNNRLPSNTHSMGQ
jgi:hypothetical protein